MNRRNLHVKYCQIQKKNRQTHFCNLHFTRNIFSGLGLWTCKDTLTFESTQDSALSKSSEVEIFQTKTWTIICLWRHFNKLLSSDINFHQDPTCHEINEKVHRSLVMMCHGWEIIQRRDAHSLYLKISIWNSWIDLSNKFINYVTTP